jgi:hypothetical protein
MDLHPNQFGMPMSVGFTVDPSPGFGINGAFEADADGVELDHMASQQF